MSDRGSHLEWELGAQARVRRAAARQRWRRYALLTVAVLAVLALVAGGAWAFWLRDEDQRARRTNLPTGVTLGPRPAFETGAPCRHPLFPEDPLRLWIGGDSLAGSLGPALGERAARTGVVLPTYDYRTSSGLASPSFFNWPEHAVEEIARVDPEVVVFIIGANDSGVARDEPTDESGEPAWRTDYGALVEEMLDILTGDERSVFWVGSPTLRDEHKNDGVGQVNDVAREVVARRTDVTFIDAYDLFADDDGRYVASVKDAEGHEMRVRTSDGIHFTPDGGNLLATYVFAYLDDHCDVRSQTVPDSPQPVRQSPGSGTVPGSDDDEPGTTAPPPPAITTTAPPSTTTTSPTLEPPLDSTL